MLSESPSGPYNLDCERAKTLRTLATVEYMRKEQRWTESVIKPDRLEWVARSNASRRESAERDAAFEYGPEQLTSEARCKGGTSCRLGSMLIDSFG